MNINQRQNISKHLNMMLPEKAKLAGYKDLFNAIADMNMRVISLFDDIYAEIVEVNQVWIFNSLSNMLEWMSGTTAQGLKREVEWCYNHGFTGKEQFSAGNWVLTINLQEVVRRYAYHCIYFLFSDPSDIDTYYLDQYIDSYPLSYDYSFIATQDRSDGTGSTRAISWSLIKQRFLSGFSRNAVYGELFEIISNSDASTDINDIVGHLSTFVSQNLNASNEVISAAYNGAVSLIGETKGRIDLITAKIVSTIDELSSLNSENFETLPDEDFMKRDDFMGTIPISTTFTWLDIDVTNVSSAIVNYANFTHNKWQFLNKVRDFINSLIPNLISYISNSFKSVALTPYDMEIANDKSTSYTVNGWYSSSDLLKSNSNLYSQVLVYDDVRIRDVIFDNINRMMSRTFKFNTPLFEALYAVKVSKDEENPNIILSGTLNVKIKAIQEGIFNYVWDNFIGSYTNGNHVRFKFKDYLSFSSALQFLANSSPQSLYIDADESRFSEKQFRIGYFASIILCWLISSCLDKTENEVTNSAGLPLMGYEPIDVNKTPIQNLMRDDAIDNEVTNATLVNMNTMSQYNDGNVVYFPNYWNNYLRGRREGVWTGPYFDDLFAKLSEYVISGFVNAANDSIDGNYLILAERDDAFSEPRFNIRSDSQNIAQWNGAIVNTAIAIAGITLVAATCAIGFKFARYRAMKNAKLLNQFDVARQTGDFSSLNNRQIKKINSLYNSSGTQSVLNINNPANFDELFGQIKILQDCIRSDS